MSIFKKVGTYSNWCEYDTYGPPKEVDGELTNEIKDRDIIEVMWPDGTKGKTRVIVEQSSFETSDMGHPCTIPQTIAYIEAKINGQKVHIQLNKTTIKVRKV